MSDDGQVVDDATYSRTYDYFKHLTTVSLVSIGGVLGLLTGKVGGISSRAIILVIVMLGLAGFLSIMNMFTISVMATRGRSRGDKTVRQLLISQYAATFSLVLGLGIFLGVFSKIVT